MALLLDILSEGFDPDFHSMSDDELIALCAELEMEDSCELDDEGRISNREQLIHDLEVGRGVDKDMDIPMESSKLDPVGKEDADVNNDGKVDKTDKYLKRRRKVRAKAIKEAKLQTPSFGGKQGNVSNKPAKKAIEDEIGNKGMKGMKKKDRPYMEKPRFRDWLTANMFFTMTKSGELAGKMKLGEAEEKEYEVGMSYVSRGDQKKRSRKFKASSPEEAKKKAMEYLQSLTSYPGNRISKKSLDVNRVELVEGTEEKEYEVFAYYESRQDGKDFRRVFKASSPEQAKEKMLRKLNAMADNKANRITRRSIKIKDVRPL